jgi:hypothetical protein
MSGDVERVALAECRAARVVPCPTACEACCIKAAAAMRETRLIDAEALRAMSAEERLWMDGDDAADWLTTRAGGE